ncbi:hypothetical protein SEA_FRANSOYER_50 [Microbacterium phage Fransoyer]|nr:hypothetical protein SEA_RUBYRALPH_50 [Microbacterium phage RubyRalph]QUE25599.1 hypothetical protein SEA_SADLAD_52 [Microbacterium phage SadLad]UUG69615.1 hypothetical protein SEA_FRANSOYER_50 [Microbacterium phage Fransoyer]
MIRRWRERRKQRRELAEREGSCLNHVHSLFYRCRNGLTLIDYLAVFR